MRTALERILDWDFEQIIVGHGAVVDSNVKRSFSRGFSVAVEMTGVLFKRKLTESSIPAALYMSRRLHDPPIVRSVLKSFIGMLMWSD